MIINVPFSIGDLVEYLPTKTVTEVIGISYHDGEIDGEFWINVLTIHTKDKGSLNTNELRKISVKTSNLIDDYGV